MSETVTVPRELLQTLLDLATRTMDYSSGVMDHEDVTALRATATVLGVSPADVTPSNVWCAFERVDHVYRQLEHITWGSDNVDGTPNPLVGQPVWACQKCGEYKR